MDQMNLTQPKKKSKAPLVLGICFGVLVVLLLLFQFLVRGRADSRIYIEAGYGTELSATNLLEGPDFLKKLSYVEIGKYDSAKVGNYAVSVRHGILKYEYMVIVQDTTAPEITVSEDQIYAKAKEIVGAQDIAYSILDAGSTFTTKVSSDSADITMNSDGTIYCDLCGSYSVTITAEDEYKNTASVQVMVYFDTAPVFANCYDYYVIPGTQIDFTEGVYANDDVDGDLTSLIKVDYELMDLDTEGTYTATYSVSDQYGLTTVQQIEVNVTSSEDIQEKINTHQIARQTQHIVGAINLYDGGYFASEDIDQVLDYYGPACVAITEKRDNGRSSRGSGFIVKIDDEYIYIMTNNHVVAYDANYKAEFFDKSSAPAEIVNRTKTKKFHDDLGLVKVKVTDVSPETFDRLMTVHINKAYYDGLKDNAGLSVGLRIWGDSLNLRKDNLIKGELCELATTDDIMKADESLTRVTAKLYAGVSGSAIMDGYGNLICVAVGISYHRGGGDSYTHYWGVRLDEALQFYEDTMGEPLYYQ